MKIKDIKYVTSCVMSKLEVDNFVNEIEDVKCLFIIDEDSFPTNTESKEVK